MSTETEALFDRMRDLVIGDGPRPIPAAVHMGEVAYEVLKARVVSAVAPPRNYLGALYGVPIVVGSLNSALPLDPRGWRILDRTGEIITEGILE